VTGVLSTQAAKPFGLNITDTIYGCH